MLKIGEFAELAQISVRMLRHYDEIGLLKPAHVDRDSGYRYYALEQLPRLNRVLALKDLGLTLNEIRLLLDEALTAEEIRGILKLKQVRLNQHIIDEQARLRRVENRLHYIEMEGQLPEAEVVIKPQPALHIISLCGSGYPGYLFRDAHAAMQQHQLTLNIQGLITFYHGSMEYQRTGKHAAENPIEVAFIVDESVQNPVELPDHRWLIVKDIPAYPQVASLISTKPDRDRHLDARVLWQWMLQHQYRLGAPTREVYLKRPWKTEDYLTEMLFPIEPISQEE